MSSARTEPDLVSLADRLEDEVARRLLDVVSGNRLEEAFAPRLALVMMTVTDPFDTQFHLGEVLVTEAAVTLGTVRGWGMTLGDAPARARLKALIDALGQAGDEATLARVAALLRLEEARLDAERRRDEERVARTRVSFDLMPSGGVRP